MKSFLTNSNDSLMRRNILLTKVSCFSPLGSATFSKTKKSFPFPLTTSLLNQENNLKLSNMDLSKTLPFIFILLDFVENLNLDMGEVMGESLSKAEIIKN